MLAQPVRTHSRALTLADGAHTAGEAKVAPPVAPVGGGVQSSRLRKERRRMLPKAPPAAAHAAAEALQAGEAPQAAEALRPRPEAVPQEQPPPPPPLPLPLPQQQQPPQSLPPLQSTLPRLPGLVASAALRGLLQDTFVARALAAAQEPAPEAGRLHGAGAQPDSASCAMDRDTACRHFEQGGFMSLPGQAAGSWGIRSSSGGSLARLGGAQAAHGLALPRPGMPPPLFGQPRPEPMELPQRAAPPARSPFGPEGSFTLAQLVQLGPGARGQQTPSPGMFEQQTQQQQQPQDAPSAARRITQSLANLLQPHAPSGETRGGEGKVTFSVPQYCHPTSGRQE